MVEKSMIEYFTDRKSDSRVNKTTLPGGDGSESEEIDINIKSDSILVRQIRERSLRLWRKRYNREG